MSAVFLNWHAADQEALRLTDSEGAVPGMAEALVTHLVQVGHGSNQVRVGARLAIRLRRGEKCYCYNLII
jgi:hypothetical protein